MHLRQRHRKPAVVADDAARQQRRRRRQQQRQRQERQRQEAEFEAEELAWDAAAQADARAYVHTDGHAAVRMLRSVVVPVAKVAVFAPAVVVCVTALHYVTWFPAFSANHLEDGVSFWLTADLKHFLAWVATVALLCIAAYVWGDFLVWWPMSADVAVFTSISYGGLTWHLFLDPAASARFAVGVVVGTVVLAVFACFSKAVAAVAQLEHNCDPKAAALVMTRGVFLLCGVGVALVPPSKRFDLLFGCVFGAELAAFDIFRYDPVNQQGLREGLRAELAVSAVAVAAMCLFAKYVAWFTMVPVLYAAWSWVVIKQGDGKVKWWLQAVAGLPTKLRRACRVAWFRSRFGGGGLKGPPSGAQCCVCWEGFSDAGATGTDFTLCIECGLGVPSPMSYACEPCRDSWLAFGDSCPVCLASGWPVVAVRPARP